MSMKLPDHFPAKRLITVLWGIYLAAWSVFEGELWTTVLAAVLTWLVLLVNVFDKPLAGRTFSSRAWLLLCAVIGFSSGFASAFLTLIFMAIKTGIHGHGPEYSAMELEWVLQQMRLWSLAGLLAGLGVGLVALSGLTRSD